MLVNFERRVCYLANPKTASQTTALALREHSNFLPVTDHHDPWDTQYRNRDVVEMGMDKEARTAWTWCDWTSFVYFYVIRNPFDTLASWFELSKSSIRFDRIGPEWWDAFKALHPRHFPERGLFLYPAMKPPGPVAVLRYEHLDGDLFRLLELFRIQQTFVLPVIGATRGKHSWPTYFDAESRAWVEEVFEADLKAGGYTFE